MEVEQIIWLLFAGIVLAMLYIFFTRRFIGRFVRKLILIDATSPESAVTAEEMKEKMTFTVQSALKKGRDLSEIVCSVPGEETRYYILPEKLSLAKTKYQKESMPLFLLLVIIGIVVLIGFGLTFAWPKLSEFWTSLIS